MAACPKCRGLVVTELVDGLGQTRCWNCGALRFLDLPGDPPAWATG